MIKKVVLLGLINLLVFTSGFGRSENDGTYSDYFPLEIGNRWDVGVFKKCLLVK